MNPDLTIVLLGSTGVGKSASGNTILGRTAFESKQSFTSVTTEISEETAEVFGKRISVIDTPGILQFEWEIQTSCQNLLQSSRPCLFLVVFRLGPFTREQTKVLTAAIRVLEPQGLKNCYLFFTGGDGLKDKSLEDFVFGDEESSPPDTFSGRCHLFDNENGGQDQVRELLMKTGHLRAPELPDRRIVLLGVAGGGRSSSGNTILGSDQFTSAGGFNLVSTETVPKSATVEGRQIVVVDTAGFTGELLTPQQLYKKIMKSIEKASPGPHAFGIVVRIGSISTENIKLFEILQKLFSSEVSNACQYSVVLFTHGDELKSRSMDDLIQSNVYVSELVSMCGGRYCVFDNKDRRSREQVRNLLNKIDEMVAANGEQHFTNDMFRMAETFIVRENSLSGETGPSAQSDGKVVSRVLRTAVLFLGIRKYEIFFGLLGLIVGGAVGVQVSDKVGWPSQVGGLVGGLVVGTLGLIAGVKVATLRGRRPRKIL